MLHFEGVVAICPSRWEQTIKPYEKHWLRLNGCNLAAVGSFIKRNSSSVCHQVGHQCEVLNNPFKMRKHFSKRYCTCMLMYHLTNCVITYSVDAEHSRQTSCKEAVKESEEMNVWETCEGYYRLGRAQYSGRHRGGNLNRAKKHLKRSKSMWEV